jgi:hypothetical protein
MIASFVLMGGFLWWLSSRSEPTPPLEIVEDTTEFEGTAGAGVEPGALAMTPDEYVGQVVELSDVEATSPVGAEAFFVNLTPQRPFLVRLDSALVARGMAPPNGQVAVTGTVHVMTDSIVSDWVTSGVVSEGDRPVVEFATHFILAENVRVIAGPEGE